jgi:phenylacetate-CoA ligase
MGIGPRPRFAALGSPGPVRVARQVLVPPGVPTPPISGATPIAELVAALNAQQPELLLGAVGVWIVPMSGYAATEAPAIATSSPEHPELEIADDVVVIEIVDEDCEPVPPGRPGAKVLLTNLINYLEAIASTGAVPPVVDVLPVPALRREPGRKLRLVRLA